MPETNAKNQQRAAAGGHDRTLLILAAAGALASFWGLFLWRELLRARAGADAFCGFGGGSDCAELWDGPFAVTVHALTGLPVAAWGVAWGAVATILPLLLWSGPATGWRSGVPAADLRSAVRAAALAGVAGVVLLLLASAAEGGFCQSCALTYVLSALYAAVTWRAFGVLPTLRGAGLAAAATAALALLLLYPGLKTPKHRSGSETLIEAVSAHEPTHREPAHREPTAGGDQRADPSTLEGFVASLRPELRQGLADSLEIYRRSPIIAQQAPRVLAAGSPGAAVHIAEFTDVLCGHCADLHRTMEYLGTILPPGSFSLDAREFPLDGNCNPHLEVRGPESVRCLAARARICLEASPDAAALAAALYGDQEQLTPERVYRLAAPYVDRGELERCVASAETAAKLRADVDDAWRFRPHGTPLVLVNGRQGTSFGPFLYAIILAVGDAGHPAFATLPAPQADAHIH